MINQYALDFLRCNCGVLVRGFVIRKQVEHDDLIETLFRRGLMKRSVYGKTERGFLLNCRATKRGKAFVEAYEASLTA